MRKVVLFFAVALVSFSLLASPSFAQEKWEYKAVNLIEGLEAQMIAMRIDHFNILFGQEKKPTEEAEQIKSLLKIIEKRLNELGNAGWELVVVIEEQLAIFKRQKDKQEKEVRP